jgi:hypothetical protein
LGYFAGKFFVYSSLEGQGSAKILNLIVLAAKYRYTSSYGLPLALSNKLAGVFAEPGFFSPFGGQIVDRSMVKAERLQRALSRRLQPFF